MRIGDLKKRITLQYKEKTDDGMGGWTIEWKDSAVVWAAIWPTRANEAIEADMGTMTATHRIRIRWRSNIKSSWRVKYKGKEGTKYYNIVSIINPNMANKILDILCKEAA